MFCALNPMVASTLGVLFLGESFTVQSIIGGMFILAGILLAELPSGTQGKSLSCKGKMWSAVQNKTVAIASGCVILQSVQDRLSAYLRDGD